MKRMSPAKRKNLPIKRRGRTSTKKKVSTRASAKPKTSKFLVPGLASLALTGYLGKKLIDRASNKNLPELLKTCNDTLVALQNENKELKLEFDKQKNVYHRNNEIYKEYEKYKSRWETSDKALNECKDNFQKADKAYKDWQMFSNSLQEEIAKLKNDIVTLQLQLNY